MAEIGDIRYRYDYHAYATVFDLSFEGRRVKHVDVTASRYMVTKVTDCGVWITEGYGTEPRYILEKWRFGNTRPRKRWAYPTKELALESFLARKYSQKSILTSQLENVRESIVVAEKMRGNV